MRVTWLVSWYPSRLAPFNGDFTRRHAEAVTRYADVEVIYVEKDEKGLITKNVHEENIETGRLKEKIIYYHIKKSGLPLLDRWRSARKYRRLYHAALTQRFSQTDPPDLLHVHVGMKAGLAARRAAAVWNIPYVVTEHWSGFLPGVKDRFEKLPFYIRKGWRRVMRDAAGASAVSVVLKNALQRYFPNQQYRVIGNVVDGRIFHPLQGATREPLLLHISGLDHNKQPALILQAFYLVLQQLPMARLEIYGGQHRNLEQFCHSLGIAEQVQFFEEVPQALLAQRLQHSAGLVLYSLYETFGCVVIESNAAGVPVVVSDIPAMRELVTDGVNGYFAGINSPELLATKMTALLKEPEQFQSEAISAAAAARFGYNTIGQQFMDWYQNVLKS